MSASPWPQRGVSADRPQPTRAPRARESARPSLIGRDLASEYDPRSPGALVPLLVLVLITALGIAALRIDLIRTRYAVAQAMQTENALIEEQRALIARKRQLRDPVQLAIQAHARGFRAPARAYSLVEPIPGDSLPAVASPPLLATSERRKQPTPPREPTVAPPRRIEAPLTAPVVEAAHTLVRPTP